MNKLQILILSAFIAFSSCKQKKSVVKAEAKSEPTEVKSKAEPEATQQVEVVEQTPSKPKSSESGIKNLVVSFYSIGAGIDLDAARKFDAWIAEYKTASGKPIVYEKIGWGREGEIDYCIQLESIEQKEAEEFVSLAKGEVGTSKLMHFTVNGTCKKRRN